MTVRPQFLDVPRKRRRRAWSRLANNFGWAIFWLAWVAAVLMIIDLFSRTSGVLFDFF